MSNLGPICRDILIANDEARYDAMEQGSRLLRQSIEDYWTARAHNRPHQPKPRDLIWRHENRGFKFREAQPDHAPRLDQHRDPCVGCGVRHDHHRELGCSAYRRAA